MAVNPSGEQVRQAKKLLFSGHVWEAQRAGKDASKNEHWLKTKLPDVLAARTLPVRGFGEIGYLRIWSFDVDDDNAFLEEVMRLLGRLPDCGLIIDIRGNPGGLIWAAERMLQLFTPRAVDPVRFSLVATPLTRAMAQSPFNRLELDPWSASLEQALMTGDVYAQALPLTDPMWCNDIGQRYGAPVVCVADANTYSSGDLFAAGFVDNEIGPLICVGEATGAGGANVWSSYDFREALADTPYPIQSGPEGVTFTMAIRRAVRSASAAGIPIEDVGVPGIPYTMTRRDVLEENRDLIAFCVKHLRSVEHTELRVALRRDRITVHTKGLDELELYREDRPVDAARPIADGEHLLEHVAPDGLEIVGRRGGRVVQRRRL